jgi:bifunctional non-homologous end joining protein LigD
MAIPVDPMRPVDGPVPHDEGWVAQPKLDGWRAVVDGRGARTAVWSRHGTDLTGRFGAIADGLDGSGLLLDGELVVFGADGRPVFHQLSARRPAGRLAFVAFDVLATDGEWTTGLPLADRLELLDHLDLPASIDRAVAGPPAAMWTAVCDAGLEGIVSKRIGSRYLPGRRSASWRRTKNWTDSHYALTGVSRDSAGRPDALLIIRPGSTRTVRVELGLTWELRQQLGAAVPPGATLDGSIKVVIRHHGPASQPRDAHLIGFATTG